MKYAEFKERAMRFTISQLRCDEPPNEDVLALLDEVGKDYEKFVIRFQGEALQGFLRADPDVFKEELATARTAIAFGERW